MPVILPGPQSFAGSCQSTRAGTDIKYSSNEALGGQFLAASSYARTCSMPVPISASRGPATIGHSLG